MPLKLVRQLARKNSDSIVQLAVSITALTKDLAGMSCFPPAMGLVGVLLLVLEAAQDVQVNKEGCNRLARRCASILLNINDQMAGRWEQAPPLLVKNLANFQETLNSIHNFMKDAASASWKTRFMKKATIETSLQLFNEMLDDAMQSFQTATLIEIHYELATPKSAFVVSAQVAAKITSDRVEPLSTESMPVHVPEISSKMSVDAVVEESIISDGVLEDQGFRRYHQSEVTLRGRSRMEDGWWSGTSEAQVDGQSSLIKRYDGPRDAARKKWIRDVKVLQGLFHPNLPQMLGYSDDTAPTPFILLSNVRTRSPESFLTGALSSRGVASCIENMLCIYSDLVDATTYVQGQLSLSNEQAQDFLEASSFRVDGSNSLMVGLPPPKDPNIVTWRSYSLNESLRTTVLGMLPNQGHIQYRQDSAASEQDSTWKLTQLTALVSSLLPTASEPPGLSLQLKTAIGVDEPDAPPANINLRRLRLLSIEANAHDYVWHKSSSIPPHKFSVGDLGYIPSGQGWDNFVILGNIFAENLAAFDVQRKSFASQWCWKSNPNQRSELHGFEMAKDVKCWPVAVPAGQQIDCQVVHQAAFARTNDAWEFLLNNGVELAGKWNVSPQSLILIAQEGTDQAFHINDFGGGMRLKHQSFRNHNPNHGHFFHDPPPGPLPRILYLSTSHRVDFEPCWSHTPNPGAALEHDWTYGIGWKTGFINWCQLHSEDFGPPLL
ncbi:hypothetical protein FB45DRAFT_930778 [Roridomyces roridus]|uniref:Mixed lineage kinase domain-containing protein n=1 Tax=Roridomyces roridus TaxID=1738132 RepID=A0AAD7BFM3_9AGAR|nr:hypothetical protein FB45DRAFT_930778 [Roridomyces roridus]